jgi:hypothetical protein
MALVTPATAASRPAAVQAVPRLTVARIVRGRQTHPLWTHVYGPEGIGKSTFGSGAPDPVVIDIESGTLNLDVARFAFDDAGRTQPNEWTEVLEALRALDREEHAFKSVVIDTLDAAEAMLWAHICKRDDKQSIEDYGYGKGYVAAVDEWRVFVAALERLRSKGMQVITLSHSIVKAFNNPEGDNFDRYQMKLHDKAAGLIKERADCVLFARLETFAVKDDKTKRVKGVSSGARIVHTTRTAAFDAKNRHDLPDRLPLSWEDYWAAIQAHRPADPAELVKAINEKAKKLGGDVQKFAADWVTKHATNAAELAKLNNRLEAKVAELNEEG